jgi:hypothetical protein
VSELDEAWAAALAEAERRARYSGRTDLADYLALKNSNDLLRTAGIEWLLTSFTAIAAELNRIGSSLEMTHQDGHRFKVGNTTMVGKSLTLKNGVRTLVIEAGWPRTPRDGIVRGGGLAYASLRHVGIKSASDELLLSKSNNGTPCWISIVNEQSPKSGVRESDLRRHLSILLDRPHR